MGIRMRRDDVADPFDAVSEVQARFYEEKGWVRDPEAPDNLVADGAVLVPAEQVDERQRLADLLVEAKRDTLEALADDLGVSGARSASTKADVVDLLLAGPQPEVVEPTPAPEPSPGVEGTAVLSTDDVPIAPPDVVPDPDQAAAAAAVQPDPAEEA